MKNKITKLLTGSALILAALFIGCSKQQSATSAGGEPEDALGSIDERVDKHGDEIMASTTKGEAREWMKQPSHIFFKENPKDVAKFVEDFYAAGATQVLIGDVEEHDGKQFAGCLLVVLPTDAAARAKLFEVGARADTAFQNDPISDKKQKYLYYAFD